MKDLAFHAFVWIGISAMVLAVVAPEILCAAFGRLCPPNRVRRGFHPSHFDDID